MAGIVNEMGHAVNVDFTTDEHKLLGQRKLRNNSRLYLIYGQLIDVGDHYQAR